MMPTVERVVYAVKEESEELSYRATDQYGGKDIALQVSNDVAKGICAKYNYAIDEILDSLRDCDDLSDRWAVFSHDDVDLVSRKDELDRQLLLMKKRGADIVVVAGNCEVPPLVPGAWWFGLVSGKFKGSGAVIHKTPNSDMNHMESYGPYPQQVAAFDGLWVAVNLQTLRDKPELRFDGEVFDGYHYYDADFSATARALDCPMWAAGIVVSHNKWGKGMHDPEFTAYQELFANKWQSRIANYYSYRPTKSKVDFVNSTVAFPTQD
jgi:hypothetical protein